ncbi:MAG: DUF3656 domain-containing protein, partial [Desulfobulbaceae bacterium]|nr:DUF3656 domain-containing protein [Desulfobulbaceae bacterium]
SFGRPASKGFLAGKPASDIAVSTRQGTIGRLLGKISTVRREGISFVCSDRLHLGDRVRILPQNDQAGSGFTVTSLLVNKRKVKVVRAGDFVTIPTSAKNIFHSGDSIYQVSGGAGVFPSEEACRKKLNKVRIAPHGLRIEISVAENVLALKAQGGGVVCQGNYPVETFAATKSPLSEETLRRVFAKSGSTPFFLESLTAQSLPAVVIPPSRLNEIRRDLYQQLLVAYEEARARHQHDRLVLAKERLLQPGATNPEPGYGFAATVAGLQDLTLLDEPDIDELVMPLTLANVQEAGEQTATIREQLVWDLPPIIYDHQWSEYDSMLQQLLAYGYKKFRLNNLGHFEFFAKVADMELVAGSRLYTLNSQAALAWQELGAAALMLSIEDDQENMRELLIRDAGIPMMVTVFAPVELFQSRIPVRGVNSGDSVQTSSGEDFQVVVDRGLTVLSAANDFSVTGQLQSIRDMGGRNLHVDLARCGALSKRGKDVLAAVREGSDLPDSDPFNFVRGLA